MMIREGLISDSQKKRLNKREIIPGITMGDVRQAAPLAGTLRYFECDTREELDARISDEQIAQLLFRNAEEKALEAEAEALAAEVDADDVLLDPKEFNSKVERRYSQYLTAYEAATPNDRQNLRSLAEVEVQLEYTTNMMVPLMVNTAPGKVKRLNELSKRKGDLLNQSDRLQKNLQIDVKGRAATRGARKAEEIIYDIIDQSEDFLKQWSIPVEHCGIEIGFIVHFFPETPFETHTWICPRCNQTFFVGYPEEMKLRAISTEDHPIDLDLVEAISTQGLFSSEEEDGGDTTA